MKLLRYTTRIYERQGASIRAGERGGARRGRLFPVLVFVVAQFSEDSGTPPRLLDLFDLRGPALVREALARSVPDFDFDVLHLARTGYDEIEGSPGGILALRLLKAERARDLLADAVWDEALILRVPHAYRGPLGRTNFLRVDSPARWARLKDFAPLARTQMYKLKPEGRGEPLPADQPYPPRAR